VAERSSIGNDVMDLMDPRCRDRVPGDRLIARILTADEQRTLERAPDLESWRLLLWAHWAAKEAAYKVHLKVVAAPGPFVPRTLAADLEVSPPDSAGVSRVSGTVRAGDLRLVSVSGSSDGRYLHVLGWSGPVAAPSGGHLETGLDEVALGAVDASALRDRFTAVEWEGVRSGPAAMVRLLARERVKAILERSGPDGLTNEPATVQIVTSRGTRGSTPPKIRAGDVEIPGWDVSLSHHGRYVAFALLVPE
jgi:phosphopantetheinyl transferase (holo-ACP synthase)